MSELRECPMCGGAAELGGKGMDRWAGACTNADCQTEGPMRKGRDAATAAWNRRASPWRTMETAPRDKMLLLGHVEDAAPIIGYWHRGAWREHNGKGTPCRPTHYQPLPEPPEGV